MGCQGFLQHTVTTIIIYGTFSERLRSWTVLELGRYGLEPRVSCWVHKPQKIYTFGFVVGNIIPKSCTVYPLSY